MAEKEKPIDYNSLIDDLIQKIDNEKSLFTLRDQLHGYGMTFLNIGWLVFFALAVNYFPNSIVPASNHFSVSITILAVLITYVSFATRGRENNVVEANFWKAIKKFKIEKEEREKRLLLEALLKIKANAPNYELGIAKKMNKEMFTKEKLWERLYE